MAIKDIQRYRQTLPDGGIPMYAGDWANLQEQMLIASLTMYQTLSSDMILSGLTVTLKLDAGVIKVNTLSEGYVLLGGEMYKFEGDSNVDMADFYIVPDDLTPSIQRPTKTGVMSDIIDVKKAKLVTSTVGYSHYIRFRPLPYSSSSSNLSRSPLYFKDLIALNSKKIGEVFTYSGSLTGNFSLALFDTSGKGLYSFNGFALCNGQNGTVDLRGRFIVGRTNSDTNNYGYTNNEKNSSDYSNIGSIGGFRSVQLVRTNIPTHTHDYGSLKAVTNGAHYHLQGSESLYNNYGGGGTVGGRTYPQGPHNAYSGQNTSTSGNHEHSISGNTGDGSPSGLRNSPDPVENRPPYYTLAYIQRIF